jgi:predicted aldo/keto reductase-like oxidoreductase
MYDCFDFVMIQHNYLDRTLQEATKKYDIITEHGLPVFVMGPTRGGILANPSGEAAAIFEAAQLGATPASLAFRYVQSFPNVSVILSGMSTIEQIKENLETFSRFEPLTAPEWLVLQQVADALIDFVPCTECRYCCGACSQNLDIPGLISTYNEAAVEVTWVVDGFLAPLADDEKPQACNGCAACMPFCPQNIDIPGTMRKFVRALERAEAECL